MRGELEGGDRPQRYISAAPRPLSPFCSVRIASNLGYNKQGFLYHTQSRTDALAALCGREHAPSPRDPAPSNTSTVAPTTPRLAVDLSAGPTMGRTCRPREASTALAPARRRRERASTVGRRGVPADGGFARPPLHTLTKTYSCLRFFLGRGQASNDVARTSIESSRRRSRYRLSGG